MAAYDHDSARHSEGGSSNGTGDLIISGTQLGIGRTDGLSTLTVQAREGFQLAGTVEVDANAVTVNGTGTHFLSELIVGDTIELTDDFIGRKGVVAIASDTSLTLDSPMTPGYTGTAMARPSAARFDDGTGTPRMVITDQGSVGIGTAGPRGMLEVNGQGAGELDYCPVGIRVHSPLNSDVWPLVMSTECGDGTEATTTGLALWVTQMQNDGGATLTFSVFNNDNMVVQDHVKIDGTGLHLASQFTSNAAGVANNYTIGPLDHYVYVMGGPNVITITLPETNVSVGRELYIYKRWGDGDIIVAAAPGETINGVPSKTIGPVFAGLKLVAFYGGLWMASVMTPA
jgi:hypothetical protein